MKTPLTIMQGDVRETLRALPADSVHCVVTSPPYWALRSYLPADNELKASELGSEATPDEYITNLVGVFREVRRVLREDGVCFVNLGETYIPDLNRACILERFPLAMQADGWYYRDCIIWAKPAPMPSSVTGWQWERHRVKVAASKRSEENYKGNGKPHGARAENGKDFASSATWQDCPGCPKCSRTDGYVLSRGSWRTTTAHELVFMFTKTDTYFCDGIAVREPAATTTIERNKYTRVLNDPDEQFAVKHDHEFTGLTRNPRSVWTIASGGSPLRHYAMFPLELPRRLIECATPAHGVCVECGAPWARVVELDRTLESGSDKSGIAPVGKNGAAMQGGGETGDIRNGPCVETKTLGWRATCKCNAERTPATVLDIFGGSGTTAEAAIGMGRNAILCELNPQYVDLIRERLNAAFPLFIGGAV